MYKTKSGLVTIMVQKELRSTLAKIIIVSFVSPYTKLTDTSCSLYEMNI